MCVEDAREVLSSSERSPRHCLLPGRQKTALRRTPVLRNGSVFPLCRGQTLNFGGGRSTWNASSASRDGHHIGDGHTGTRSTAAGRSARSLQRTSGNKAHGGFSQTTSLLQSILCQGLWSEVSRSKKSLLTVDKRKHRARYFSET